VWFTYDGATLYALRDVGIDADEPRGWFAVRVAVAR